MGNREQIIRDLAISYGLSDIYNSKETGAKYDRATGTMYCDGLAIPKHTIDKAIKHFRSQIEFYKYRSQKDSTLTDLYLISIVAFNAINMLEDNINRDSNQNQ